MHKHGTTGQHGDETWTSICSELLRTEASRGVAYVPWPSDGAKVMMSPTLDAGIVVDISDYDVVACGLTRWDHIERFIIFVSLALPYGLLLVFAPVLAVESTSSQILLALLVFGGWAALIVHFRGQLIRRRCGTQYEAVCSRGTFVEFPDSLIKAIQERQSRKIKIGARASLFGKVAEAVSEISGTILGVDVAGKIMAMVSSAVVERVVEESSADSH